MEQMRSNLKKLNLKNNNSKISNDASESKIIDGTTSKYKDYLS